MKTEEIVAVNKIVPVKMLEKQRLNEQMEGEEIRQDMNNMTVAVFE